MSGFLYKGIVLQQHKEPALSRDLREFFNADTIGVTLNRPETTDAGSLTPQDIIDIARAARIIDERDGKLLADKLQRKVIPRMLVADAIDDEPYISSQLNPLLKNLTLAEDGLKLAQRATGTHESHFAVYKSLIGLGVTIPKKIGDFQVKRIRGRYPAEYQASQVYGDNRGTVVVGVGSLIHLARAVQFNKPQTTTFVTVAGNCVANSVNLEVSLGMTVSQVLERCGLIDDPVRVVVGGSMTGFCVLDTDNTLITASTRAILAFRENFKKMNFSCVGCGRCVQSCPEGLNPFFLYRSITEKQLNEFSRLDAERCIGCGTCSYMCPAKLDLSETIRYATRSFSHTIDSMATTSELLQNKEDAAFQYYMRGYEYGKAVHRHAKASNACLRTQSKRVADAVRTRKSAEAAADRQLASDRSTMEASKKDADRRLAAALSLRHATENEADRELAAALAAQNSSIKATEQKLASVREAVSVSERLADKRVLDAQENSLKAEKNADHELELAAKAKESALRTAEKGLSEAVKQRAAAEHEADKQYHSGVRIAESTQNDAQKALREAFSSAQPGDNGPAEAQKKYDQVRADVVKEIARLDAVRAQASVKAKSVYDAANKAYLRAQDAARADYDVACAPRGSITEAQNANIEAVRASGEASKVEAHKSYASAEIASEKAKAAARVVYKAAQKVCEEKKQAAKVIYEAAEVECEKEKAAAEKIYAAACEVCAHAHAQALAAYDLRSVEIDELMVAEQNRLDAELKAVKVVARVAKLTRLSAEAALDGSTGKNARRAAGKRPSPEPTAKKTADPVIKAMAAVERATESQKTPADLFQVDVKPARPPRPARESEIASSSGEKGKAHEAHEATPEEKYTVDDILAAMKAVEDAGTLDKNTHRASWRKNEQKYDAEEANTQ